MVDAMTISTIELPLLLKNLKKVFGEKIHGPVNSSVREYQLVCEPEHLHQIANFLLVRGVKKLVAINAWRENQQKVKLAYYFIAKIGPDGLDSKIAVIVVLDPDKKTLESLTDLFVNARIFESEISSKLDLKFQITK